MAKHRFTAGREQDKMFHTREAKGIVLSQSVLIQRGILELYLSQNHSGNKKEFTSKCHAEFLFALLCGQVYHSRNCCVHQENCYWLNSIHSQAYQGLKTTFPFSPPKRVLRMATSNSGSPNQSVYLLGASPQFI